jgi:peptidoglycan/xylan/chitin deacetylase (PgdA/CDA1 family)
MFLSKITTKLLDFAVLPTFIFELFPKGAVTVFNYHEITSNPSTFSKQFNLAVHPDTFKKQLSWIRKYFTIVKPMQLIDEVHSSPLALITFDDGFASTFKEGGRILKEMDIPATVFVNMGPIKGELFWSGLITYLCTYRQDFQSTMLKKYKVDLNLLYLFIQEEDVEDYFNNYYTADLSELIRSYYGEFASEKDLEFSSENNIFLGNHLFNHYNAANISPEKLSKEYTDNQSLLKNYSNYVNFFSYPFGQPQTCYTEATDKLIFELGAIKIFTAFPLPNTYANQKKLHRISMFNSVTSEGLFRNSCIKPLLNSLIPRNKFNYI